MKTKLWIQRIAILTVCLLGVAALGSEKNPVERPFKLEGQYTLTVNLATGTGVHEGFGVASHTGRFVTRAEVWVDADGHNYGVGTCIAANGDEIFWQSGFSSLWDVEWSGGSGRFASACGGWKVVSGAMTEQHMDSQGNLVVTFVYTGEGTITYGPGNQVSRPMKWSGQNVVMADFSTAPTGIVHWRIVEESGNGTHVGAFICEGEGEVNLITGHSTATGLMIAANGDRLFWELQKPPGASAFTLTIVGGTGRFANAGGVFTGVPTVTQEEWDGLLLYMYQDIEGTGTLTY
jgi:hypothetical protein